MIYDKKMVCIHDKYTDATANYLTKYKCYNITHYDPNNDTVLFTNNFGVEMWTHVNRFITITEFRKMQISKLKERIWKYAD